MSDLIQHECGIALIRLKKPMEYYQKKYGTALHGFNKLFLLMEKQHNRGQDGAGIGCVKLNMPKGQAYMFRERVLEDNSLSTLFKKQLKRYDKMVRNGLIEPSIAQSVKEGFEFGGEVLMGHLRYGTSGNFNESSCHPYFRRSNWPTRNLMVLGNFNMTNTCELNQKLIERGQHPIFDTDTQTVLEEIGFHLDEQHQGLYRKHRDAGLPGDHIPEVIGKELDMVDVLRKASEVWDGGYVIAGMVGNGDSFVMRDPKGIRPCFWFEDEEFIAFASERVPLMTVFEKNKEEIRELTPGSVVTIRSDCSLHIDRFAEEQAPTPCSFERIYFSRGNDPEIYQERKALGSALMPQLLDAIEHDLDHALFSFIPNTAETAFYGMLEGLRINRRHEVKQAIMEAQKNGTLSEDLIDQLILNNWPRSEKIAHKDIKLRTFISQEKGRSKMVSHVYDISYGIVSEKDSLVVLDDSIVRGTTLRDSIIKILSRTKAKRIVVASTAPQIRYPDCYGIDMSELGKFIAFQAATDLLKKRGMGEVITNTYKRCLAELDKPAAEQVNCVKAIYEPFGDVEVAAHISTLLRPKDIPWDGELKIVFQTIESLHKCLPNHNGDWYFTGNYPTPGGTTIANLAFVNYYEKRNGRSYDRSKPACAIAK
ncbi:MAG: amidophosphoribosyltransferase [Opitutales bacterium]|nr:amidophosphoribosyltransferase [Opitutales bacterium]